MRINNDKHTNATRHIYAQFNEKINIVCERQASESVQFVNNIDWVINVVKITIAKNIFDLNGLKWQKQYVKTIVYKLLINLHLFEKINKMKTIIKFYS